MIPVRLELYNFLPYRHPDPIYFEGIHLACLTGANGAGKTSLLDAITWVLWGRARARRDDDLVHLGQDEMYVQLDFEQEGVVYRVHRKRKSGKRGHGELNLFVIQDDGNPRLISEPSIRQTQGRIERILRLDYETFVNSAFLQQGEADAFTTKTAAERKRILSNILGLDRWKVYEQRAKDALKEIDRTLASIDGVLGAIEEELAKEAQYKADKRAAEEKYSIAKEALADAEKRLAEVADAPADLRNAQESQASVQRHLKNFQGDLEAVQKDIAKRRETIAAQEEIVNLAEQIEQGYDTLQSARQTDSDLSSKLRQMSDLDKRYNELQQQLAQATATLQGEKRDYQATIRETQRLLEGDSADALNSVQEKITALETLDAERDDLHETISNLREERSGLQSERKNLTQEGTDLNERIDALQAADGATCPLCGQTLDSDHRAQVLDDLTTRRDTMRENYRQANERLNTIATELTQAQKRLESLGDDLAALPKLRSRAGALQKQLDDAAAAQQRLDEAQAQLNAVQKTLDDDDYAHDVRAQLAQLDDERRAIGYDPDAHDSAQAKLDEYAAYERQYHDLEFARKVLPDEREALENAQGRQTKIEAALAEERERLTELEASIATLEKLVEEERKRRQEVAAQRTAATQAHGDVVAAEQQLGALDYQRERKAQKLQQRRETEHQQGLYEELRQAFGKNGVPAMIIESAIPELETSANELLSRMTDGRMHVRFSTQREKVSGGTMETLDIDIADELGTRPYEMYSGGEAFRINFAIRVALSKMLARRAGAHLRTLFIDEGFGTQDDDGRNKLVEAIQAVQDDFDLILVITHIAELRDAFPVHVIVEKTGRGSAVTVR